MDDTHNPTVPTHHESLHAYLEDAGDDVIRIGRCFVISKQRWTIALYSLSIIALFADQNLMAPNLSAIADEFGFSDEERDTKLGGDIAIAFFFMGALASVVAGFLTDVIDGRYRSALFAIMIVLGEGACLLVYFVQSYRELYICRALTGLSVGAAVPLIYSVLGDLYASDERNTIAGIVSVGQGLGMGCGQILSGFVGPRFGWRMPFLVVSIPALITACFLYRTVRDPPRGAKELQHDFIRETRSRSSTQLTMVSMEEIDHTANQDVETKGANSSSYDSFDSNSTSLTLNELTLFDNTCGNLHNEYRIIKRLLRTPTILLMMLQASPGCLPWGVINTYLNDYLAQDREMGVEGATLTITIFGIGLLIGMIGGGKCGEYLYNIDVRYPSILMGSAAILGTFAMQHMINNVHGDSRYFATASVSSIAGISVGITGPLVKATLTNVTLPSQRGRAFAMFTVFNDVGNGLGPAFVAMLIVRHGRQKAFNLSFLGWVGCGFFNLLSYFYVKNDEDMMRHDFVVSRKEASSFMREIV